MKTEDLAKAELRPFKARPDQTAAPMARLRVEGASLDLILRCRPLVVEIGCGVGLHPIQYAENDISKNIIAIERTREKFEKFEGRLRAHPHLQDRLCAVHADAIHFLDQKIQDASLDEVWILYPNPEVAKVSRRWFHAPFMGRLVQLMRPCSTLYFATNIQDYAAQAVERSPLFGFQIAKEERIEIAARPEFSPRTHFEKKYFERGETLFNFEFRLEPSEV